VSNLENLQHDLVLTFNFALVSVFHGRKLIELLKPEVGIIREGTGHVFMVEEWKWHNEMIENQIEKVSKRGK